jgi:hypothetical protein
MPAPVRTQTRRARLNFPSRISSNSIETILTQFARRPQM